MTDKTYTALTFSPVQGFIEKSRKLRDLYGSSFLLSFLGWVICYTAKSKGFEVISPALPDVAQGMPNQIIIEGEFSQKDAKTALDTAWKCVMDACREWIEEHIREGWEYNSWKRIWGLWSNHAWEFFWVQGESGKSISDVRELLNEKKRSRGWTGINWQGESSTLSGADAIAYPELGKIRDPRQYSYGEQKAAVTRFYEQLSEKIGESFIDPNEELSVPELVKRLITYEAIANKLITKLEESFPGGEGIEEIGKETRQLTQDLKPKTFRDLSRVDGIVNKQWTGWFQGDGDKAGEYLKGFAKDPNEAVKITEFSTRMREWGKYFKRKPFGGQEDKEASVIRRVIYAGGDDFLGVFYSKPDKKEEYQEQTPQETKRNKTFKAEYCVKQFSDFKSKVWDVLTPNPDNKKSETTPITVSVGFVWASPSVPQRDVLQNCREAEKSAKTNGRDRIAFRILFSNGNYLEWVCPWWLLEEGLLSGYKDRESKPESNSESKQNWTHIYKDVATLEARHAFNSDSTDVSFGLLDIYFPKHKSTIKEEKEEIKKSWWNSVDDGRLKGGILGEEEYYYHEK